MKNILTKIVHNEHLNKPDLLVQLIEKTRPSKAANTYEAIEQIENLIAHLNHDETLKEPFAKYISTLFSTYEPVYLYSDLQLLNNTVFTVELWSRLKQKLLPKVSEANDISVLLRQLFYKHDDYIWLKNIPIQLWIDLLESLDLHQVFTQSKKARIPMTVAIQMVSHHIATLGVDFSIIRKLTHLDKIDSPFLVQNKEITRLTEDFLDNEVFDLPPEHFQKIMTILDECDRQIYNLRRNKAVYGTSLHLTYITRRARRQIKRLRLLLQIFRPWDSSGFYRSLAKLMIMIVDTEQHKTSIRRLFDDNINLLAFEIVEHTAQKGGKYIANNAKEYWKYLRASMLGGLIIAFFAAFKIGMDGYDLPPIGQGLMFSINYAGCFVLVKILGGIIATKQPAMTASAVAQSIDDNNTEESIENLLGLKSMIIKVSHSQFISFVGNLICAFPVAYLIAKVYEWAFHVPFISDYKADYLLYQLRPLVGGAVFYAAIAGFFLSLSGLISGYFDNKVVFSEIPKRIKAHPTLIRIFNTKKLNRFAKYIEKNLGMLAGNISLGFLLGMSGTIGQITGLPIDIRHIAFSSANLGFATEHGGLELEYATIGLAVWGVVLIGMMNFLISFGMTLLLAMKSRRITFKQTRKLFSLLTYHLLHSPVDFFIARKSSK